MTYNPKTPFTIKNLEEIKQDIKSKKATASGVRTYPFAPFVLNFIGDTEAIQANAINIFKRGDDKPIKGSKKGQPDSTELVIPPEMYKSIDAVGFLIVCMILN